MRPLVFSLLLLLLQGLVPCLSIMVPSGKLEPISPPDPAPRVPPPFPLVPPAPVYEDPEPYTNLVLPIRTYRNFRLPYGLRLKPLPKHYPVQTSGYSKHRAAYYGDVGY